jgi:hypothetical protein
MPYALTVSAKRVPAIIGLSPDGQPAPLLHDITFIGLNGAGDADTFDDLPEALALLANHPIPSQAHVIYTCANPNYTCDDCDELTFTCIT